MRLLFDENLPPSLSLSVQQFFPGSAHVHDCGLGACSDSEIWEYAIRNSFTIVSKDADFEDEERSILVGFPPKVIWLRTGNCTKEILMRLLISHELRIRRFLESTTDTVLEIG